VFLKCKLIGRLDFYEFTFVHGHTSYGCVLPPLQSFGSKEIAEAYHLFIFVVVVTLWVPNIMVFELNGAIIKSLDKG